MSTFLSSPGLPLSLKALLFCVFDKETGPTICCSDPPNAVDARFKPLGRYLLPEPFVQGKVVSLVLDDNVILGTPVYIEDIGYFRNCFQFNICAVIGSRVGIEPYRDLAQKLAISFRALEVEIKLLSNPADANVNLIKGLLGSLRRQIGQSGQCFVRVDSAHCISFVVHRGSHVLPAKPDTNNVAVPLVDLAQVFRDRSMLGFEPDAAIMKLIGYIDGVKSLREVSMVSRIPLASVVACVRHLQHYGMVAVIDDISLKGRYSLTPRFHTAFGDHEVVDEVVRYVTAGKKERDDEMLDAVQGLYAAVNGWKETLGDFQKSHAIPLQHREVSLRHFITFGLIRGFLERIDRRNEGLSAEEIRELYELRKELIPNRKRELTLQLRQDGDESMTEEELMSKVNRDPQVLAWVDRMNELKARDKKKPEGSVSTSFMYRAAPPTW